MRDYRIKRVWIDPQVKDHPLVGRVLERVGEVEVKLVPFSKKSFPLRLSFKEGKETIFLTKFPGNFIKPCPGTGKGYLCCGYKVINQPINCPMDCTYCILQDYLGPSPLILYVNFDKIADQLNEFFDKGRGKTLRIGNGELSDSLALDYLGNFSSFFVSHFKRRKNLIFEFKTKTDEIEKILLLPPAENVVISWSLNPPSLIQKEEHLTASLDRRLKAAYLVQKRGFKLSFHFDPLIFYPGWESDYQKLIKNLFTLIHPSQISWISLGALRFPPSLKEIIQRRFPQSRITCREMIRGLDGKLRYIKPLRIKMFRKVYQLIRDAAPQVFCYLCMESPDVWEKVMGFSPSSNLHFQHIFEEHVNQLTN
jgi:spore photoproduct lyase